MLFQSRRVFLYSTDIPAMSMHVHFAMPIVSFVCHFAMPVLVHIAICIVCPLADLAVGNSKLIKLPVMIPIQKH